MNTFKYRNDRNCRILADRKQIRQVFVHLLDNAVKYTERGFISFGYYVLKPDLVDFFVTDTGARMYHDNPEIFTNISRNSPNLSMPSLIIYIALPKPLLYLLIHIGNFLFWVAFAKRFDR